MSETSRTTNFGQSAGLSLSTVETRKSTIVSPSCCSLNRLDVVISMELMLACASESMMSTFLPWNADSVSASASTIVDLPTPPLVFITAMVLRMALTSLLPMSVGTGRACDPPGPPPLPLSSAILTGSRTVLPATRSMLDCGGGNAARTANGPERCRPEPRDKISDRARDHQRPTDQWPTGRHA